MFSSHFITKKVFPSSKDTRIYKTDFPDFLKNENILIVIWKSNKKSKHINDKFNWKGFFILKKNGNYYSKICFGKPFSYKDFINGIKNNEIIFDSGMHMTNPRPYSTWRSSNQKFWYNHIIEEY